MNNSLNNVVYLLNCKFNENINCFFSPVGELIVEVKDIVFIDLCYYLRNNSECIFDQLIDICGVDYLTYGIDNWSKINTGSFSRAISQINIFNEKRFCVVYHLLSIEKNHRISLKVFLDNDKLLIDSCVKVWPVANWYEREIFDMFGICFFNHPDLRRILTDYGFQGYPLRKDFPTEGEIEIRYDDIKEEIVYEPVTISERCLIPKVIRTVH